MNCSELVNHLLSPDAYPHAVDQVKLRETHISWVFLTGKYAYKLKKPVNLGFADFTSSADRKKYCFEEVRRNQLYSPGIYLDVVPVTRSASGVKVGGAGTPIEYLVRMQQFDDSLLASSLATQLQLTLDDLSNLAQRVANFHQKAERSLSGVWGTPDDILQSALENVRVLRALTNDAGSHRQLGLIEGWTVAELDRLTTIFKKRKESGFIRQCHGDLHLGNLVRWQGQLTPFDCIEFNPDFYWIDVLSEVAFLVMDLDDHGRSDLGWHFLNEYLEHTGDYEGLSIFRFYRVYRAMVRAKVCELRLQQNRIAASEQQLLNSQSKGYLAMAFEFIKPKKPFLAITHGVSGSGKTYQTQSMVRQAEIIRIRSDVERKRMRSSGLNSNTRVNAFGTEIASTRSGLNKSSPIPSDYSEEARDEVYSRLAELTKFVLDANYPVLIDATFLKSKHREQFRKIAQEQSVPFYILKFEADKATLRSRIMSRLQQSYDASEATQDVLEIQLEEIEPLNATEALSIVQELPKQSK